jgi:DNA invertase Pin-like site-specific DNA recombinase
MGKRKYQPQKTEEIDPKDLEYVVLGAKVIIYYRQSTPGQVGNSQTEPAIQELKEMLLKMGWRDEDIIIIKDDAGVKGSVPMDQRIGLSKVMNLILGPNHPMTFVIWDEDRTFREDEMIEVNKFIKILKEGKIRVLTKENQYHFAHPTRGREDIKRFRAEAQRSADYTHYQIKGRLQKGKQGLIKQGLFAGHGIALGFMVDKRKYLNGADNPNYRKYTGFPLTQRIMLRYFEMFYEENGNLSRTAQRIEQEGPFIPEEPELQEQVPPGFQTECKIDTRSAITGGRIPAEGSLHGMFTNAVYVGYWISNGQVISIEGQADNENHEAIIPEYLFYFAFNRLSNVTVYGADNPDYQPYRPFVRHPIENREGVPYPKYAGLVRSNDMPNYPNKTLNTNFVDEDKAYIYILKSTSKRKAYLTIRANKLDAIIDQAFKEYLSSSLIHEELWQALVAKKNPIASQGTNHLKSQIRALERDLDAITAEIPRHPETSSLRERLLRDYDRNEAEIKTLKHEIRQLEELIKVPQQILSVKEAVNRVIDNWDSQSPQMHCQLLSKLSKQIIISNVDSREKRLRIVWRDETVEEFVIQLSSMGIIFTTAQIQKLLAMVQDQCEQWQILKAFPGFAWEPLRARAKKTLDKQARQDGIKPKKWTEIYKPKRVYPGLATWQDTKEYEEESNLMSNQGSSKLLSTRQPISIEIIIAAFLPLLEGLSA